ncbi:ECF transporter S component [Anaerosalibacter bizertensis]|uniref:Riboflavin transporter n=1 Tax=Anaerosalibacter bizertensis TaxID=932217 RepID=A0A844FHC7_9FIRM|nr:ECF transporter S component [Anaerosalibacter bizertensis]MBV1817376.1 ECF transporter S component [Bacteroidales bacterium MSK.15.36]MCB5558384.1 ECF transporter S component [Anaerosalibacter bizertensis]MCG4564671.1 ECF transporter S component [Anaerosalibacter bizertensis]MCG4582234.1 ECF transporter S component [Anaerosalibacter bizertensis]MCG4584314.1 ECF transporter S component [Anaerosalibacter bizertensis]
MELKREKGKMSTRMLTKVGVLSAIAFILMLIEFPLWFAPPFLKMDLSEVPALMGAFALGPVAGVLIELIKNILNVAIEGTSTGGVGELANFVVGSIFVYTAGYIYHKNKNIKNAIIGMIAGTIAMTIAMAVANYYVMIPFYAKLFGMPLDKIVAMGSAVNKYVVDFKSLIIYAVVPFNILKGVIVTSITFLLYKKVSPILHK